MARIETKNSVDWLGGQLPRLLRVHLNSHAADESGISFWLPGLEGSLAAAPTTPGWSLGTIYYHTSVNANGAAAAAREFQVGRFSPTVNINLNLSLRRAGRSTLRRPRLTPSRRRSSAARRR